MKLKEYRQSLNITIEEAASSSLVPVRTYIRYENDDKYGNALKRKAIYDTLQSKYEITETKGLLSIEKIKNACEFVFSKYENKIEFCYLFGSYAKGYAKDDSDIDLFISTSMTGFDFVSLIDELKNILHKKIDLIRLIDANENIALLSEVMKDGIKVYG